MKAVLVAALALVLLHRPVHACATAPPRGEEAKVADEEAVIVWDPATKTETFIRRAAFQSTARRFGFLVPTPTPPTLGEAPDNLFWELAAAIAPDVVHETKGWYVEPMVSCMLFMGGGAKSDEAKSGAPAVRVIQTAHVAGFDAVTLEADAPQALADWLGAHGFDASPELTAWLAPYVAKHWKLSTFVIDTGQSDEQRYEVATKAVKMTFHAEQPFYPYSEPDPPRQSTLPIPPRMLRVFFVSDQRYTGKLGAGSWNASTLWSAALDNSTRLDTKLPRTTVFIDEATRRNPTDDVVFVPHTDQSEVKQPPIIVSRPHHIYIPIDLLFIAGIIIVWRLVKRARRLRV